MRDEEGWSTLTIGKALQAALRAEMYEDPTVVVFGENVGAAGGSFGVTKGLLEEFGPDRVRDTPISEAGFTGMAVGAAMTGLRPVVDIMFSDFATLAMSQLVEQAAYARYMSGGQASVPLVFRCPVGAGSSLGAQHSQSMHAWFAHVPGLKVAVPATPADAAGLLRTAIRDPDPVVFIEDKMQYSRSGSVRDDLPAVPFGEAAVHRTGTDVTVVAMLAMVHRAVEAAEILAADGVDVEVVDPRTLTPLDRRGIAESAARTGRVVVVDQGYRSFGAGAELASTIAELAFDYLERPIVRIGGADVPVPFSPRLERRAVPTTEAVVAAVREVLA